MKRLAALTLVVGIAGFAGSPVAAQDDCGYPSSCPNTEENLPSNGVPSVEVKPVGLDGTPVQPAQTQSAQTQSAQQLPVTGSDITYLVGAGVLMVGAGGAMLAKRSKPSVEG